MADIPLSGITVTGFKKEDDNTYTNIGSYTTDSPTGEYSLGNLEPGNYTLKFVDPSGQYLTSYYGGKDNLEEATLFEVVASTILTGKNHIMVTAAGISGTVTGPEI